MRTIAHISDLHFGRLDPAVLGPLHDILWGVSPDLVVVTGDLTQRARRRQFLEAAEFLETLPKPQLVVPGNHDVPLYRVLERFRDPLRHFKRLITADLRPVYEDSEIVVVGINTARSLTLKSGRINREQAHRAREQFRAAPESATRIVATHHPFVLPEGGGDRNIVGRSRMAMEIFAASKTDLFLAGHMHVSHSGDTAARYRIAGHSALVISAGTATSTRGRGEPNSFNVVRIERPSLFLTRFAWSAESRRFGPVSEQAFQHTNAGWLRGPAPDQGAG